MRILHPFSVGSTQNNGEATLAEEELLARLRWFIRHRWLAAASIPIVSLVATFWFRIELPLEALSAIALGVALYNLLFDRLVKAVETKKGAAGLNAAKLLANAQISSDLTALALLLHFSGGIENPFAFFFIFHIIIASILLSPRATFAQAGFATLLFSSTVLLEARGLVSHFRLWAFLPVGVYLNPLFLFGSLFVLAATLFLSAYFATSITRRLRLREAQVVRLSKDLGLAYERLAASEQAKALYMRKVSHELRAPLAALQSILKVNLEGFLGPLQPRQAELLQRADQRAGELLKLIEDLLILTRSREAPLEREKVHLSLKEVVQTVIGLLSPRAEAKNITLQTDVPSDLPSLFAEPESIRQLFTNLISNAIRYTPEGGKVSLSVSQGSSHLHITVSDTGIGIAPEDLPNIFNDFFRADNARRFAPSGTGLGLSIVKAIVVAHAGSITAKSEPNKGTTFEIHLPLAA
jgi:signal transduction histidine kinase